VRESGVREYRRYAVYDPGPAGLADFGAAWLGWDMLRGCETRGLGGALAATPRRYGFHATIKAPFRLAPGCSPDMLVAAFQQLCAGLPPVTAPGLQLRRMAGVLALVFEPQPVAVTALAAEVVRGLDGFRAPLTPDERARRRPELLGAAQRALLDRWGYPWVMDEFRYHMTLTGPLSATAEAGARQRLQPLLEGLLPCPHPISALALMGEDAEGRFHLLHHAELRG